MGANRTLHGAHYFTPSNERDRSSIDFNDNQNADDLYKYCLLPIKHFN